MGRTFNHALRLIKREEWLMFDGKQITPNTILAEIDMPDPEWRGLVPPEDVIRG